MTSSAVTRPRNWKALPLFVILIDGFGPVPLDSWWFPDRVVSLVDLREGPS